MKKNVFDYNFLKRKYSIEEIKIIFCYIFDKLNIPLKKDFVFLVLQNNDIANYFEMSEAFFQLIDNKYIKSCEIENDINQKFKITLDGNKFSNVFQDKLSISLRKKILKYANEYIEVFKNKEENTVKIEKNLKGYNVKCSISGGDFNLMELVLYAPDLNQALKIKNVFYKNINDIYEDFISKFLV